jgi:hypothetical protein
VAGRQVLPAEMDDRGRALRGGLHPFRQRRAHVPGLAPHHAGAQGVFLTYCKGFRGAITHRLISLGDWNDVLPIYLSIYLTLPYSAPQIALPCVLCGRHGPTYCCLAPSRFPPLLSESLPRPSLPLSVSFKHTLSV